jgi:hypothetical protein
LTVRQPRATLPGHQVGEFMRSFMLVAAAGLALASSATAAPVASAVTLTPARPNIAATAQLNASGAQVWTASDDGGSLFVKNDGMGFKYATVEWSALANTNYQVDCLLSSAPPAQVFLVHGWLNQSKLLDATATAPNGHLVAQLKTGAAGRYHVDVAPNTTGQNMIIKSCSVGTYKP